MSRRSTPSRRPVPAASGRGSIRIIGGKWKRSILHVVDAPGLRPTPDRVRETLFNWLVHARGGDLEGCVVLDLFAGTGVLGFEAASRGAARVVLVEANPAAVRQLIDLHEQLRADGRVEVVQGDALAIGARFQQTKTTFDLIFLDPPFGQRWLDNALPLAVALCTESGLIYVEAEAPLDAGVVATLGLEVHWHDRAGDVFYHLLRRNIKE